MSARAAFARQCFRTGFAGGSTPQQASEHAPRDPDHPTVLPDLDPETHGLLLGVPASVLGKVKNIGPPIVLWRQNDVL